MLVYYFTFTPLAQGHNKLLYARKIERKIQQKIKN